MQAVLNEWMNKIEFELKDNLNKSRSRPTAIVNELRILQNEKL